MDLDAPDYVLLEALGSGDRTAFEVLATRHQGLVHAACLRQAPRSDLDDCIQAVFLVLLRKPHQARRAPALAAWLLVVARHVCATARRAASKRQLAEQEASMRMTTTESPTTSDHASEHLDACLAQLPARQRAVITLHYLAGVDREEVARDLAIDIDTVHQHCRRGLERLRDLLRRKGVAVPAVGVLALLSSQAQTAASASTAIPTTAASATASAYASGAMTAMTIATITPASLVAAALLMIAGAAIGIAGAETAPTASPPAAAVIQDGRQDAVLETAMAMEVKVDLVQTDIIEVAAFLEKLTGLTIVIDPKITPQLLPPVTMAVSGMRAENVLRWVERLTQTHHEVGNGGIFLTMGPQAVQPDSDLGKPWKQALDQKLDRTISLDLLDSSLPDAMQFIQAVSGLNIICVGPTSDVAPITFKASKLKVSSVITSITQLSNARFEQRDQAIGVYSNAPPSAAPRPVIQHEAPGSPSTRQF